MSEAPMSSACAEPPLFRFVLELRVRPQQHDEFRAVWDLMAAAAARHPANVDQLLAQCTDDPDVYQITSDWTRAEAYREFSGSAAHDDLAARMRTCTVSAALRGTRHVTRVAGTPPERTTS